jgi:hypothetical protein
MINQIIAAAKVRAKKTSLDREKAITEARRCFIISAKSLLHKEIPDRKTSHLFLLAITSWSKKKSIQMTKLPCTEERIRSFENINEIIILNKKTT